MRSTLTTGADHASVAGVQLQGVGGDHMSVALTPTWQAPRFVAGVTDQELDVFGRAVHDAGREVSAESGAADDVFDAKMPLKPTGTIPKRLCRGLRRCLIGRRRLCQRLLSGLYLRVCDAWRSAEPVRALPASSTRTDFDLELPQRSRRRTSTRARSSRRRWVMCSRVSRM